MTRKELNQIYYINKEIEMWQRELENLRAAADSLESPKLDGLPRGSDISNTTENKALRMVQIQETIGGLLTKLQMQRAMVYEFIATVDDSLMRQIMMYRCLSLCTWEEVALYVGGRNTPDSVRMMFNRYFDE